jgi:thiamine kinase-like enzyme
MEPSLKQTLKEHVPDLTNALEHNLDILEGVSIIAPSCLLGGLSNVVYRIDADDASYVVRIAGANSEILGGKREAEIRNTMLAGSTGVAPKVFEVIASSQTMILEHIEGISLDPTLLTDDRIISATIEALSSLHSGERFSNTFSMFDLIRTFQSTLDCASKKFKAWTEIAPQIERSLFLPEESLKPCHNDAFPKNWILDSSNRARLVDFEYSGQNDPAFDLATLYVEAGWDIQKLSEVLLGYYRSEDPTLCARVWLQSIPFDIGWSLYAEIQSCLHPEQQCFSETADLRWQRAFDKINSSYFTEAIGLMARSSPP